MSVSLWETECTKKGGHPGWTNDGAPVCSFPDAKGNWFPGENVPIALNPTRPERDHFTLAASISATMDQGARIADKIAGAVTSHLPKSPDLMPKGLTRVVLWLLALVILWGAGVQAGILPPVRKVFK